MTEAQFKYSENR